MDAVSNERPQTICHHVVDQGVSQPALSNPVAETLDTWAADQVGEWRNVARDDDNLASYHRLARHSFFHFTIENNHVICADKPFTEPGSKQRASYYKAHLEAVLAKHDVRDCKLLIDVDDLPLDNKMVPVFAFQKLRDQRNILLPDVDFLGSHYYADQHWGLPDRRTFTDKKPLAFFAGATTGGGDFKLTDVIDGNIPRIKAARAFKDSALVDFRLPRIVQCTDEARASLEQEGFGVGEVSWSHQLTNKFLITMDGNGAACSRLYVSLMSNSVPLKFTSQSILFYFPGLQPDLHYIDVPRRERVSEIVEIEQSSPGYFASIASEGRRFASEYLTRAAVEFYTWRVLSHYADRTWL